MNIVLAGATGFIGQKLVLKLQQEGHSLTLLSRHHPVPRESDRPGIVFFHWDAKTVGDWAKHIDGSDAVINLAGEPIAAKRWTGAQKERILASRLDATGAIVDAIAKATKKPEVLINASAVGYYGDVKEGDVTESHSAATDFLGTTCARWEEAARKAEQSGVRVVMIRTGIVLEKTGGALKKLLLPFRLFAGGPLGSGNQWFPWVHIEDEVGAIVFALSNKSLTGPVNLAAPQSVTMREFCRTLGKTMGRPSWAPVPAFVLQIALGEMSTMLLGGQKVIPKKLQEAGYRFRFPQLEMALRDVVK
jgi:hypothetical protein